MAKAAPTIIPARCWPVNYHRADPPGVYGRSDHPLLEGIQVILLNELTAAAHNTFLKCFASRRQEQEAAFKVLQSHEALRSSWRVEQLLYGLRRLLMRNAPKLDEVTPEYVMRLGQEWIDALLKATPADEVMKHYTAEERLAGLEPQERLAGLTPEQIRRYLEQLEQSSKH